MIIKVIAAQVGKGGSPHREPLGAILRKPVAGGLESGVGHPFAGKPGHVRQEGDDVRSGEAGGDLIVGRGDGEQFLGSGIPAFLAYTRDVQYIEDGEIVTVRPDGVEIEEARWFDAEALPTLPTSISISRRLIDTICAELASRAPRNKEG